MITHKQLLLFTACVATAMPPAFGADIITTKLAEKITIHTGEVVRCEVDGVNFKLGSGEIKIYKADIKDVQIDKPAGFEKAQVALRAHQFDVAINELKPIADRYGGLPLGPAWIEDSVGDLGDAYLGMKKLEDAQRVYDMYAKFYPAALGPKVKTFRIKAEKKECKDIAEPLKAFLDPYLKKESLPDDQEAVIAEALIVQGDCQRASNKLEDALDSYLLAVTVFNIDNDRSAQAKFNAGQVFEQMGKWDRARGSYEELQAEAQGTDIAVTAKSRLEDLNKAHPK